MKDIVLKFKSQLYGYHIQSTGQDTEDVAVSKINIHVQEQTDISILGLLAARPVRQYYCLNLLNAK